MQTVFEVDVTSLRAWREWLELLFPLVILAVLFLARQIRNYAKGRQLRSLAPFLNGQAILRPFAAPRIQGLYMGYPFRLSFFSRGRNSPGRLELQIEVPLDFRLEQ